MPAPEWNHLRSDADLDAALAHANNATVVFFKHSTRCPVSSMALRLFERNYQVPSEKARLYFLDLIAYRPLSNRIANELGVEHESPQLIVVKNGHVAHSASHHMISAEDVKSVAE